MRISLFGGLEVAPAEGGTKPMARRSAQVLALLVLAGGRGLRREQICEMLWGNREEAQARASLRQALVELRRCLGDSDRPDFQIAGDGDVIVMVGPPQAIDVRRFEQALHEGGASALQEAAGLYLGELLAGLDMPGTAEDWVRPRREEYFRKALQLAENLSELSNPEEASIAACEALAKRLLLTDPAAEEAHRALIRIYKQQGKTGAAARQLRMCTDALKMSLGVEPEARTMALLTPEASGPASPAVRADAASRPLEDGKPSVVVLPFENLSGSEDACLVEGVTEEITAMLSRIRDFFVIARQSALAVHNTFADVRQLGAELGVRYVVQGAVRRAGSSVRISVHLVDAESRAVLWTERYEGDAGNVFALQDRIAEQVAGAIHPALMQAEIAAAKRKPPENYRAYELLLQAYPKIWRRTESENRGAIGLINKALALDPQYGRAWALLAWCHSQNIVYLWSPDAESEREFARRAIAAAEPLAGDDPMALTALGAALSQSLLEQDRARTCIEAALALDPNSAWAWARMGWIILQLEEFDAAKDCFERALRLSPLDPLAFNFRLGVATCWGHLEAYDKAVAIYKDVLNRYPDLLWAHRMLSAFAALAGDLETARASVKALLQGQPHVSIAVMRSHHPGRNTPRLFGRLVKGWRLAGLPEE